MVSTIDFAVHNSSRSKAMTNNHVTVNEISEIRTMKMSLKLFFKELTYSDKIN